MGQLKLKSLLAELKASQRDAARETGSSPGGRQSALQRQEAAQKRLGRGQGQTRRVAAHARRRPGQGG